CRSPARLRAESATRTLREAKTRGGGVPFSRRRLCCWAHTGQFCNACGRLTLIEPPGRTPPKCAGDDPRACKRSLFTLGRASGSCLYLVQPGTGDVVPVVDGHAYGVAERFASLP